MDLSSILNTRSSSKSPAPPHPRNEQATTNHDSSHMTATFAPGHTTSQSPNNLRLGPYEHSSKAVSNGELSLNGDHHSYVDPIEPSPPVVRVQQHSSASLERYHHGSKSPEQQRRESISNPPDLSTVLAPIRSMSGTELQSMQAAHTHYHEHGAGLVKPEHDPPSLPGAAASDGHVNHDPSNTTSLAIKIEPIEATNAFSTLDGSVDRDTEDAIRVAANEHGTRTARPKPVVDQAETPTTSKKNATAKAGTKKGIARKPAAKKRKIEHEGVDGGASGTSTPMKASKALKTRKSQSNTPRLASSPTSHTNASSPAADDPGDDDESDEGSEVDDGAVYCICRKPDNHSWMIACDGGCDDWFHGKCVKIQENQGELIDKYICPNCEKKGKGGTTWKPCCRRVGCNMPAQTGSSGDAEKSKYCSEACGKLFLKQKADLANFSKNKKTSSSSKSGLSANDALHSSKGGVLKSGEIKALAVSAKDAEAFRQLGDGILSPPNTASPEDIVIGGAETALSKGQPEAFGDAITVPLNAQESTQLAKLANDYNALTASKSRTKDREAFLRMVVDRILVYAEKDGVKPKDVCGYDSRLAWGDTEFARWWDSPYGKVSLEANLMDTKAQTSGAADAEMVDALAMSSSDVEHTFCARKRCEQHKQWQKVALNNIKAELQDYGDGITRVLQEQKELKEQAAMRWRAETAGGAHNGQHHAGAEGWAEKV